jgi:hypothetical protein
MAWLSDKESSSILTAISMRDTGLTIKLTEKECILMPRARGTRATGRTTSSTVSVLKSGMKAANMRVDTLWARKKDKENTPGLMDPHIVENGLITELMGKESTCGKMAVNIMESGSITIWKAMVSTTGQMEEDMKDSITTMRNAVLASTIGQMDANMKDGGIKASSMALGPT